MMGSPLNEGGGPGGAAVTKGTPGTPGEMGGTAGVGARLVSTKAISLLVGGGGTVPRVIAISTYHVRFEEFAAVVGQLPFRHRVEIRRDRGVLDGRRHDAIGNPRQNVS